MQPFGLANRGADCYFNALIQAIWGSAAIRHAMGSTKRVAVRGLATGARRAVFRGPPAQVLDASPLLRALQAAAAGTQFARGGTQSASEALQHLADYCRPLRDALELGLRYGTECVAGCNGVTQSSDDRGIMLVAPPQIGAEQVLLSATLLDGQRCPTCRRTLRRVQVVTEMNEVLVLQRPEAYGAGDGPGAAIAAPERLVLGADLDMQLVGMVEHHGPLGGGHYVAYGLRGGNWWHFDDAAARPCSAPPKIVPGTYLLVYSRVE